VRGGSLLTVEECGKFWHFATNIFESLGLLTVDSGDPNAVAKFLSAFYA